MPKQNPSLSVNCVFPTTSSTYLGVIVQLYFSKKKKRKEMLPLPEQGPRPIPPAAGCLGRTRFKIPWEILKNLKPTRVRKSIIFTISIRQKKKNSRIETKKKNPSFLHFGDISRCQLVKKKKLSKAPGEGSLRSLRGLVLLFDWMILAEGFQSFAWKTIDSSWRDWKDWWKK